MHLVTYQSTPAKWIPGCLSEKAFILVYVDDCLIFSQDKDKINQLIDKLKNKKKLDLTDEGDVDKYLGVEIERNKEDKSITFKKTFLIQRAIELLGLRYSNQVDIPAIKPPLSKDLEGASRNSSWEYRSIIVLLNYIPGSSRPDIANTTHSAARFSANPKIV